MELTRLNRATPKARAIMTVGVRWVAPPSRRRAAHRQSVGQTNLREKTLDPGLTRMEDALGVDCRAANDFRALGAIALHGNRQLRLPQDQIVPHPCLRALVQIP